MRWLIDGNNVMGARPDGWWRDRAGAAARLAHHVDAWQRRTGDDVVLVFDGPPRRELVAMNRTGFAVRFAPGAGGADELIAVLAAGAAGTSERATTVVVTSDAGLAARLPDTVTVRGAGSFRGELEEGGRPDP